MGERGGGDMKGISKDEEVGGNGRFCQVSLNMNNIK